MRIERLEIDAFGHFDATQLGPLESDLIVIHGPNETGKSTLVALIHTLLFGFPAAGDRYRIPALSGAPAGGRVVLRDDLHRLHIVERHADAFDGRARLIRADGSVDGEPALHELLGCMPRTLYRGVFTLGVDELQRLAELAPEGMHDGLFDAALGLDQLRGREQAARATAGAIFAPNDAEGELAQLLDDLASVERDLETGRSAHAEYPALHRQRAETVARLEILAESIDGERQSQLALALARSGWSDWVAFSTAERRLAELGPAGELTDELLARLDKLEAELRIAEREAARRRAALEAVRQRAAEELPDGELLGFANEIDGLRAGLCQYEQWVQEFAGLRPALLRRHAELGDLLAELGPEWSARRLVDFDPERIHREEIRQQQRRLDELHADLRATAAAESAAVSEWHEADQARAILAHQLDEALTDIPAESLVSTRVALARRARERWTRLELARRTLADERARSATLAQAGLARSETPAPPGRQVWLPVAAVALGIACALLGVALGGNALWLGLAAAGLLVAGGVASWFLRPGGVASQPDDELAGARALQQQRLQRVEADVETARAEYRELAGPLGIVGDDNVADLENIERSIEAGRGRQRALDLLRGQLHETELSAGRSRQRLQDVRRQREALTKQLAEATTEWRSWLRARELPPSLTPDGCAVLLRRIERVRRQMAEIDRDGVALHVLVEEIERYQRPLRTILDGIGEPQTLSPDQPATATIDELLARYELACERSARQQQLASHADIEQDSLSEQERDVRALCAELQALLATVDAESADELRLRAQHRAEVRELNSRRATALERLQRLSGPGEAWLALRERLEQTRYDDIRGESEAVTERIAALEAERAELLAHRGELDERLRQMEYRARADALPQRRAALQDQLRERVDEWVIATTAAEALAEARRRFAAERQPAIVSRARTHFSTLTGGAYRTIADMQGPDGWIEVVDTSGRHKRVHELSRGTREQLFLAFRLALIEDFSARLGRLPALFDDVLVNYDPTRADAAICSLTALSRRCQVIFFTCHPTTVERFAAADAPVQIIDLGTDLSAALPVVVR